MSKRLFQEGLKFYRSGDLQQALECFNKSINNDSTPNYIMLDTRAATYAKLGQTKEALKDAKKTIEVAPERWQGYGRAAQLFLDLKKADASLTMVKLALSKLGEKDADRRVSLLSLEAKALTTQADIERHRRRFSDHMGNLPIEIFGEIARIVVRNNHTAVIRLSQVSKHWRNVVHNSPYLWDVLVLDKRRPKQKAKLWIERTKGKLYDITILPGAAHAVTDPTENLLQGVRWDELHVLKFCGKEFSRYLQTHQPNTELTSLQHLDVTSSYIWDHNLFPCDLGLRHLALRQEVLTPGAFSFIATCTKNLATLTLESVHFMADAMFRELLEASATIESLVLHNLCAPLSEDLALTRLTCLDIKSFSGNHLKLCDLPQLRILRLESTHAAEYLLEVVERTSPYLTELVLRSCAVSTTSVIAVLEKSPGLQILEVSNIEAHKITEFLAASNSSPPPLSAAGSSPPSSEPSVRCSHLTSVNFSKCADVQTGPIVRMIKARLPPPPNTQIQVANDLHQAAVHRITSLTIDECPNIDSAWLPWIREHVSSVSCVYMKKKTKFRA